MVLTNYEGEAAMYTIVEKKSKKIMINNNNKKQYCATRRSRS